MLNDDRPQVEGRGKAANETPELRKVSVEELGVILAEHKKWLELDKQQGKKADLSNANLRGADLEGANLRKANLKGADLQNASLMQANLEGAALIESNLERTDLRVANLQGADLQRANLQDAVLNVAELQGADLRRANLQGVELKSSKLQGADLERVNLRGANLRNADMEVPQPKEDRPTSGETAGYGTTGAAVSRPTNLRLASLRDADLSDAKLSNVTGLQAGKLGGADLSNAKLPEDIARFEGLGHVTEISRHARNIFLAVVGGCVFSWLTIATTTDVALLTNSGSSPLPIIQTKVPIAGFYWAAPAILLALYAYLHLYLQRLWEGMASLPAIFPDGRTLDESAYPWLLSGIVRAHVPRLTGKPQARLGLQVAVSLVAAWMFVPGTLGLFWLRYLPRHDWPWTLWLVALFVVAIAFGTASYRLATTTLRGEPTIEPDAMSQNKAAPPTWKRALRVVRGYRPDRYSATAAVLGLLISLGAIEGRSYGSETGVPTWGKANLARVDLGEEDLRNANLQGANLQGAFLNGANLQSAILVEAKLQGANLLRANLAGADLRGATGLTQKQLGEACGDEKTKLPDGLTIKPCPDETGKPD